MKIVENHLFLILWTINEIDFPDLPLIDNVPGPGIRREFTCSYFFFAPYTTPIVNDNEYRLESFWLFDYPQKESLHFF